MRENCLVNFVEVARRVMHNEEVVCADRSTSSLPQASLPRASLRVAFATRVYAP